MPSGARQGWLVATGIMLMLCLLTVWQSSLLALSDRLGPGPGFFPFWLALIGTAFCLAQLVEVWRTPAVNDGGDAVLPDGYGRRRIGAILGAVAIAALVMEVVGFQLTMLAFNLALVVALGERRWLVIIVFAVAGSFGVYQLFTRWLDVLLPAGTLGI